MFAGKSDVLHKDCPSWKGCTSMCDIADDIYWSLVELEKQPDKFLDKTFMMSIFDKGKVGNLLAKEWHTYTYVYGRKSNTVGSTTKEIGVFAMDEILTMIFESQNPAIKYRN